MIHATGSTCVATNAVWVFFLKSLFFTSKSIKIIFYLRGLPWMHDLTILLSHELISQELHSLSHTSPLVLAVILKTLITTWSYTPVSIIPVPKFTVICFFLWDLHFLRVVFHWPLYPLRLCQCFRNVSAQYIFVKWSNKPVDTTTSTSSTERSITCLKYCAWGWPYGMVFRYVEESKWEIVLAVFANIQSPSFSIQL